MNIIETLKKKLRDIQESLSDNQGWVRQGRLTLEPIRERISSFAQQNPQSPIVKWATTIPSEEIPFMGKTFTMPKIPIVSQYIKYVAAPQSESIFKGIQSFAKVTSPQIYGKPTMEDVGNIAGAIGSINPISPMIGGLFGASFKALENVSQKKPITEDLYKGYRGGFEFQAKLGPISGLTGSIIKPLFSKLNPAGQQSLATYIKLAKNPNISQEAKKELWNMVWKTAGKQLTEAFSKGFIGMGAYGAMLPAKNTEERIKNFIEQGIQGGIFEAGAKGIGQVFQVAQGLRPKISLGSQKAFARLPIEGEQKNMKKLISKAIKEKKITVEEGQKILKELKEKQKDKFIEELEKINNQIQIEDIKPKTKPPIINPSELEQKAFHASFKAESDKKGFIDLINKWVGKRRAAEYKGIKQALNIEIPKEIDGREVIKKIENPDYKTTKDVENVAKQFRKIYDELYKEAKKSGIDINYIKNYITHIWKEPIEEVAQKYQTLSKKFKFSKERILPTYEEGIKMGLTPKYNNPQQILAEYVKNLEKVKANLEFFNALKEKGYISEKRIPGFVPIQAPGFPTKIVNLGERMVEGTYFAPKEIADKINEILSPKSDFLDLPAKIFSGFQDIVMSGGLPKTPINAWTAAQIKKELAAGRIRSPIKALGIAMSDKATLDYFKKNLDYIIKMEEGGIPVRSTLNIGNLANKSLIEGFFGKNLGEAWHKFVNEPTFKRFMPILNIEFYKNTYESLIKNGVADDIARQKAAEATKNFYGIVSSGEALLRNKTLDNLFSILFFAPRYRESLLRFFYNSIKGLKNPLAPENINNTRFILGALITYLGMNEINKLNTGKNMWENPKGLEDKMLIKTDDGYIGVPFFSGIFTVPRGIYRQTRRLIEGDYSGMAKDVLQTYSSALLKPMFDIFANSDYFGKPIYEVDDDTPTRHKKILSYLITQYTGHPYIRELFDPRSQNDPAYQRLSRALELPLRFYTQKSMDARTYYEVRDNILKGLNKEERESFDYISLINKKTENPNDPNVRVLKYRIYYKYPKVFEARQAIELQMALKTNKPIDPLYLVDSDTARKYIVYESLPEASPERKAMIKAYPELSVLFEKRSEFFKNNPYYKEEEGITKKQTTGLRYPEPSEYVKKQMEAKNWSDPEVQKYLEALRTYQNQQRLELGLLPVDEYGNIVGSNQLRYSRKKKKIKIGSAVKLKSIKIAMPKARKIKITFPKTEVKVPDVFKTTKKKVKIKPKAIQLAKKIASLV